MLAEPVRMFNPRVDFPIELLENVLPRLIGLSGLGGFCWLQLEYDTHPSWKAESNTQTGPTRRK